MWINNLPAFIPFYVAAVVVLLVPNRLRQMVMVGVPIWGAMNLYLVGGDVVYQWMSFELILARLDALSLIFAYLFHLVGLIGGIYALNINDRMQQVGALAYIGSALGAVFAGDLLTLFIFWECLALSSVFLIWARRTQAAFHAGMRYLIIQILSGLLLLGGALIHYVDSGSLLFNDIGLASDGGWLIFFAFGIKCAFPLLHNWLSDAYPEATGLGAVFLSAITTKLAIYALARGYSGVELLIYIGVVMACFPIFYAVMENDLRRVLSYSLIGQLGFMVIGIGIGTALALNGAVAHAFVHAIYKSLLFMVMGGILFRVGHTRASDLGGLYKTMPKTTWLCIIGAASISAVPLFSGFISKTLIMSAALEQNRTVVWLLLLFASAGTLHYAGIKIPYLTFFAPARDRTLASKELPNNMLVAMILAAGLCLGVGMWPQFLYAQLPWAFDYWPYDLSHVLAQLQLLFASALAFVWLNQLGWYPRLVRSVHLDVQWFYRRGIFILITWLGRHLARVGEYLLHGVRLLSWDRLLISYNLPVGRLLECLLVLVAMFIVMGV